MKLDKISVPVGFILIWLFPNYSSKTSKHTKHERLLFSSDWITDIILSRTSVSLMNIFDIIVIYLFILLDILFIYISNVIPFPDFSPRNTLSHLPHSCFYQGVPPTIHPLLPPHTHTGASSLHRTKDLFSHWCQTRPSSAAYMSGAMGHTMCTPLLVVQTLKALVGWCCSSYGNTNTFSFFHPFSNSSIGLTMSIHLYICQALAERLRRQLYSLLSTWTFLASTIVSVFGNCIWDESPGGALSGCHFLQSLSHTLSLYLLQWVFCYPF